MILGLSLRERLPLFGVVVLLYRYSIGGCLAVTVLQTNRGWNLDARILGTGPAKMGLCQPAHWRHFVPRGRLGRSNLKPKDKCSCSLSYGRSALEF